MANISQRKIHGPQQRPRIRYWMRDHFYCRPQASLEWRGVYLKAVAVILESVTISRPLMLWNNRSHTLTSVAHCNWKPMSQIIILPLLLMFQRQVSTKLILSHFEQQAMVNMTF